MRGCIQSRSAAGELTVLGHGDAVLAQYRALVASAGQGDLPAGWRMPSWWTPDVGRALLAAQPDASLMERYLRYHDCGKPYCLTVDEQGRSHFPDHASVSAATWAALGGHEDEVWLMRNDMLLHVGSAEECSRIQGHRLAPGLLWAALSEIHANAQMFGGTESTSFKVKAKQLDRRGAALVRGGL